MSRIERALEKAIRNREGESRDQKGMSPQEGSKSRHLSISLNNPLLVSAVAPHSLAAEEFRKLKSHIVNLTKTEKFLNTLMITSAVGDEGKSITSLNLALSLADDYDHTVLLIDADFRAPSLHRYLGVEPQMGFTDCIKGNLDVERAIIETNVSKLSFLPAGKVTDNPVEMISSNRMRSILGDLKHRCANRYIIIDTPPALPFADAHYMSSIVDGVIFVVREGRASEEEIGKTLKQFEGRRFLGAIFNCANTTPFSRYYSHYYRYPGK